MSKSPNEIKEQIILLTNNFRITWKKHPDGGYEGHYNKLKFIVGCGGRHKILINGMSYLGLAYDMVDEICKAIEQQYIRQEQAMLLETIENELFTQVNNKGDIYERNI